MGFWIFMFLMILIVPLAFLGIGHLFRKSAPKDINYAFGYRTKRSMMNPDTWKFAHQYIGRLWFILGIVVLPLSIIPMSMSHPALSITPEKLPNEERAYVHFMS